MTDSLGFLGAEPSREELGRGRWKRLIITLLARQMARALICVSVKMTGVDQGLKDAQYVFEAVLDDLAPMLREMPNLGS